MIIWNKVAGGRVGQESSNEKRKAGLEYIEKLRKEYPNLTVVETDNEFLIETNGGNNDTNQ